MGKPGDVQTTYGDSGGASRFFYCAKSSKSERNKNCEALEEKQSGGMSGTFDGSLKTGSGNEGDNMNRNNHPTVKPLKLMEYLCNLTKTPTGGIVLDPFAGSGTTGIACKNVGREYILIEKEH
jgi:site-specific DNA-methyltransferase (adenine-specific)